MKKRWLDRFAGAVRWYLPRAEADDVLADYREMLDGDERGEAELRSDLGKPRQAARMLVQPRPYRVWLGVFLALAVCLALPGLSPLPGVHPAFWNNLFGFYRLSRPLALVGVVGAIVYFRWKGHKEARLPRALPVFLTVLLVWCALVLLFSWATMHDPGNIWNLLGNIPFFIRVAPYTESVSLVAVITHNALEWIGGLGMAVVGVYALVKARTEDRRWAAVYILAMTAMMVSLNTLAFFSSMDVSAAPIWEDYFAPLFWSYVKMTAAGLVGTGVALC